MSANKYYVCPQCGPYAMNYGTYTKHNCYSGDSVKGPDGKWVDCQVRERFRDFYGDGVQGGTCQGTRTDDITQKGLLPPFATYGVNYWGDLDPYRKRPYGGQTELSTPTNQPESTYLEPKQQYQYPTMIRPLPFDPSILVLPSIAFPGSGNVKTCFL